MSPVTSTTYDYVLRQIQPYLGEKMARALIQLHCQAVGVTPEALGPEQLGLLTLRIETALKAFLGSARAAAVVRSFRPG